MKKKIHYDLGFSQVEIHEDYLKNTIQKGFIVTPEHNDLLVEFVQKHYKNQPFVYISNRIHSYSVDPTVYLRTSKIENLVGMAVVSKNPLQQKLTELENTFFKKELKYFKSLDEAISWKNKILQNVLK